MRFLYLFKFAAIYTAQKGLKLLLTASGITISIAVLVFLVSLGYGLDQIVTSEIANQSTDRVISVTSGGSDIVKINASVVESIISTSNVSSIEEIIDMPGKFAFKGTTSDTVVSAVSPGYFKLTGINLPNQVELKETKADEAQPIIINSTLAKIFGFKNPKDFLGQEVYLDFIFTKTVSESKLVGSTTGEERISGGKYLVVAVINQGNNAQVFVPQALAKAKGAEFDTTLLVAVSEPSKVSAVREKIEVIGLKTASISDSLRDLKRFFGVFRLMLVAVGLISFIVAIIGLLNINEASLIGRMKEISWLRALGMKDGEVRLLLITESLLLSAIGAIGGIVIGLGLGNLINLFIKIYATRGSFDYVPLFRTPVFFLILVFLLSILMGGLIGLFPARKVLGISPKVGLQRD